MKEYLKTGLIVLATLFIVNKVLPANIKAILS